MTLAQFAVAIGAQPKWVQNAFAVLDLQPTYSEERARRLALARMLKESHGIPLKRSWAVAGNTLAHPDDAAAWRYASPSGSAELVIDRERFLSWFTAALSRARVWYAERRRGRPRRRRRGVAGARDYGVDIGLLEASLRRTPAERLRRLDEDVAFFRSLQVVEP